MIAHASGRIRKRRWKRGERKGENREIRSDRSNS
jgi:hypothetical protein